MGIPIYPRDERKETLEPVDQNVLAARIISAREKGKTKAQSIGDVLQGSHDVPGFDVMWDTIESERGMLLAVDPAAFDTEAGFVAALNERAQYLDTAKWLAGILAQHDARDWASLQAKLVPVEI